MATVEKKIQCYHCGDDCLTQEYSFEDKHFCCSGCLTVYDILNQNGLCQYYELSKAPGISKKEISRKDKYAFLDQTDILSKIVQFKHENRSNCTLHVPQMHCSSCLWILEHLSRLDEGVISSQVNFERKEVFIIFDHTKTSLRKVVELLDRLGYEPLLNSYEGVPSKRKYSKKILYRLGVAGFCYGNIMMLSIPEYLSPGGVDPVLSGFFRIFSIILALPVALYCAMDIFKAAYGGLKHRHINIDMPVALAIVITFFRSLYDIAFGLGQGYLDSMAGIVFFVLIGRWLQNKTYESILFNRHYKSFFPIAVDKKTGNGVHPVSLDQIEEKDVLVIHHGEIIPTDSMLSKGTAIIDYSFVSGETHPVLLQKGEIIYAGGKQTEGIIEIIALKKASQSYLTNLWNRCASTDSIAFVKKREDMISRYFTAFVLLLGFACGGYWLWAGRPDLMWNALTSVLIVACPCVLLLASNFTNGYVIRLLGRLQCYVKDVDTLYRVQGISHVIFDKTGTITDTTQSEVAYKGAPLTDGEQRNIASLLSQSLHPISRSVVRHLQVERLFSVEHYKETPGKGLEGWMDEQYYKIGSEMFVQDSESENPETSLYVSINNQYKGKFIIKNIYRKDSFQMLNHIKSTYRLALLSGDNESEAPIIKQHLGENVPLLFRQRPEDKLQYVNDLKSKGFKVLMVGDGLNDAFALKQSDVGISVSENKNNFTPSADIIINANNIPLLDKMLRFANSSKQVVNICFSVSIVYNIIGLFYALKGVLSPLTAAILMMLSSISIMLLSYGLTHYYFKKIK